MIKLNNGNAFTEISVVFQNMVLRVDYFKKTEQLEVLGKSALVLKMLIMCEILAAKGLIQINTVGSMSKFLVVLEYYYWVWHIWRVLVCLVLNPRNSLQNNTITLSFSCDV